MGDDLRSPSPLSTSSPIHGEWTGSRALELVQTVFRSGTRRDVRNSSLPFFSLGCNWESCSFMLPYSKQLSSSSSLANGDPWSSCAIWFKIGEHLVRMYSRREYFSGKNDAVITSSLRRWKFLLPGHAENLKLFPEKPFLRGVGPWRCYLGSHSHHPVICEHEGVVCWIRCPCSSPPFTSHFFLHNSLNTIKGGESVSLLVQFTDNIYVEDYISTQGNKFNLTFSSLPFSLSSNLYRQLL